jgi:copper transport protein
VDLDAAENFEKERSMKRRWVSCLVSVSLIAVVLPTLAWGHATLLRTEPASGAIEKHPPSHVVFSFSEPVETVFSAVRVYDAEGHRVDDAHVSHPGGRKSAVAVGLPARLPQGTYTATYRVISADGHPVSGGVVYSVGKPGMHPMQTVAELTKSGGGTRPTSIPFDTARALQDAAIAVALGGLFFFFSAWLGGLRQTATSTRAYETASNVFARRTQAIVLTAAGVGVLSAAAGIVLEGASATGGSVFSGAKPSVISRVLGTEFGTIWGLRVMVWALLGALILVSFAREAVPQLQPVTLSAAGFALPRRFPSYSVLGFGLAAAVFLALSPALAGHPHTEPPRVPLVLGNFVHVAAMAVWAGGLVMLLLAMPWAARELEGADRTRLTAAVVSRFSTLAGISVALILLSGVGQSIFLVHSVDNALHTSYGHAVLIKIALVFGLLGLGAFNRQVNVPRLRRLAVEGAAVEAAARVLRRAVRAEVALVVVVLGTTGVLTGLAPATKAPKGPFAATTRLGPAELQLTVDPARIGHNVTHVDLMNPVDGMQYAGAKEVTLAWSLPDKQIGAITQTAEKMSPGHYIVDHSMLAVPGKWKLTITARVSEFDAYYATLNVPIR